MLSCDCSEYDGDGWYYYHPNGFDTFSRDRRKRCCSCDHLLQSGDICIKFPRRRASRSDVEERIRGDEVTLASWYMCEWCGEMFFNLTALGYCINLGDSMKETLEDYWELTGFKPQGVI